MTQGAHFAVTGRHTGKRKVKAMGGDFDQECVQTFEQVKEELERLESELALHHNLRGRSIRGQLFALDRRGQLGEDARVARWHEIYSVFTDWLEWQRKTHHRHKMAGG